MTRSTSLALLLALLVSACAGHRSLDPGDMSGFLDDYSRLRRGGAGEVPFVYRNPEARWSAYHKLLLEPVTLWRSGRDSLAPIAEQDLLRLVSDFEAAVRRRFGAGFELVDAPSPGTLRLRLAITEARASDRVLDVLSATGEREPDRTDGRLSRDMREFIDAASIEGEIRDAETDVLLAQGVDRRRTDAPPIATWAQLDGALDLWAERMCSRLEARTGPR